MGVVRSGRTEGRLEFLDCLRGVAVILVFVMHSTWLLRDSAGAGSWLLDLAQRLDFGRMGVVIFFALSGFLIPSSLKGGVWKGTANFLIGRFFRLFPAFWVSIVPSAFAIYWLFGREFGLRDLLLNATMVPRLLGAPMANGAYWTLEVELFFYLVCVYLFVGGVLRNAFLTASIALVLGLIFYSSQRSLFGGVLNPKLSGDAFYFWLHVSIMFWGATFRKLWDGERLGWPALGVFALYSFYALVYRPACVIPELIDGSISKPVLMSVSGYNFALLIFTASVLLQWPRLGVLAWLGRISYSFYLLHGAVIWVIVWLLRNYTVLSGSDLIVYVVATFGLGTVVAASSYYAIEAPAIAFGRRFSRLVLTADLRLPRTSKLTNGILGSRS